MWPYTSDEQVWLVPAKDWAAEAEGKKPKSGGKPSAERPAPRPMPAPYDDGISDPQIILRK